MCTNIALYKKGGQSTNSKYYHSNAVTNSYYFGTLHSHPDYSDSNKDNPGFTPADDYLYAMTANCLDYLGISEHNHFSSVDNPANQVGNYHQGSIQGNNFTSTHPNFLALYGMEWGVISGGGHLVIYGDGMDDQFGWETGAAVWGLIITMMYMYQKARIPAVQVYLKR